MPGKYCAVAACANSLLKAKLCGRDDLSFHRFPKDLEGKRKWIEQCSSQDKFNSKCPYICSDHFLDSDFESDLQSQLLGIRKRKMLKPSAFPSINLLPKSDTNNSIEEITLARYLNSKPSDSPEEMIEGSFSGSFPANMTEQSHALTGEASSDRTQVRVQRRWTDAEADQVLNYLLDTVASGELIEKPTAELYYQKMQQQLSLINCSSSQLKGKVKNLRKSYNEAVLWCNEVGQGIRQSEGETAFLRGILRRCPKFELLDKVFSPQPFNLAPTTYSNDLPQQPETARDMMEPEIFIKEETASSEMDGQASEAMSTFSSSSSSPSCCQSPCLQLAKMESPNCSLRKLLCDTRNQKTANDSRRLDLEMKKFEFEKQKWYTEVKLRSRELDLEEKRIENSYLLGRYELDLKYNTHIGLGDSQNHEN